MGENLFKSLEDLENNLRDQYEEIELEVHRLRRKNDELIAQNEELHRVASGGWELNAKLQKMKFLEEDFQATKESYDRKIKHLQESLRAREVEIAQLKSEEISLKEFITELEANLETNSFEAKQTLRSLHERDNEVKFLKEKYDQVVRKASHQLDQQWQQINDLVGSNKNIEKQASQWKQKFVALTEKYNSVVTAQKNLEARVQSLESENAQLTTDLQHAREEIFKNETYSARLISEGDRVLENYRQVSGKTQELESEIKRLQGELQDKVEERLVLKGKFERDISMRDLKIEALTSELTELKKVELKISVELASLKQEHEALVSSSRDRDDILQAHVGEKEKMILSLESQISLLSNENQSLRKESEREIEELRIENTALLQILREKNENEELERRKIQDKVTQIQVREEQLKQYASSVASEKNDLRARYKQLANELRSAGTLHPLKDYLQYTEFELAKVEVQLKKTPVVSIERPRLESYLEKLTEQKRFLESVITKSQKQLESQASILNQAMPAEVSAALPPIPPLEKP